MSSPVESPAVSRASSQSTLPCSPTSAARLRPTTTHFDPQELYEAWRPTATLVKCDWAWSGDDYKKNKSRGRASHGDTALLEQHKPALLHLLTVAPTGFPAHADLRMTFLKLNDDEECRIFGHLGTVQPWHVANEAADVWRLMCRHLYNQKRSGKAGSAALHELLDIIIMPTREEKPDGPPTDDRIEPSVAASPPHDNIVEPAVAASAASDIDTDEDYDCEITREMCMCPLCATAISISSSDEEATAAAASDLPIPDPRSGKQRKDTAANRTRAMKDNEFKVRLRKKSHADELFKEKATAKPNEKQTAIPETQLTPPARMIHRKHGRKCAYLIDKEGVYIANLSVVKHREYVDKVRQLKAMVDARRICTKGAARQFLQQLACQE